MRKPSRRAAGDQPPRNERALPLLFPVRSPPLSSSGARPRRGRGTLPECGGVGWGERWRVCDETAGSLVSSRRSRTRLPHFGSDPPTSPRFPTLSSAACRLLTQACCGIRRTAARTWCACTLQSARRPRDRSVPAPLCHRPSSLFPRTRGAGGNQRTAEVQRLRLRGLELDRLERGTLRRTRPRRRSDTALRPRLPSPTRANARTLWLPSQSGCFLLLRGRADPRAEDDVDDVDDADDSSRAAAASPTRTCRTSTCTCTHERGGRERLESSARGGRRERRGERWAERVSSPTHQNTALPPATTSTANGARCATTGASVLIARTRERAWRARTRDKRAIDTRREQRPRNGRN